VPISGRNPAPDGDSISIHKVKLSKLPPPPHGHGPPPPPKPLKVTFDIHATGPGTAHIFLWTGDHANIPVFLSSCGMANDPPPDYGFTPCAVTDGGIPPWSPDMSGRVVRDVKVAVSAGKSTISIPLDAASYAKLSTGSSALISFETPDNKVQAFDVDLAPTGDVGGTVPATLSLTLGPAASFGAFTPGVAREYTASTSATVISTAGDASLTAGDPSTTNTGKLVNGTFTLAQPVQVSVSKSAWTAPASNDQVTVSFRQAIGANEALRTGTYSKTFTFTLSTTTP